MSEVRYEAHPLLFRMRPLSTLAALVLMFTGILMVGAGRVAAPGVLEGMTPGGLHPDTVQLIGIALFGLLAIQLYIWYAPTRFERLTITDEGLRWHRGFIDKERMEIPMKAVSRVQVDQSQLQRWLYVGDVSVYTGEEHPTLKIRGLPYPERISELVEKAAA